MGKIKDLLMSPAYRDLSPNQIVPRLANEGKYLGSESTMYRFLRKEKLNAHRDASKPKKNNSPKALTATGPNQVWSWDISYLPTRVLGMFLYLYLIEDVFSRKIVAWQVHDRESSEYAASLATEACFREQINRDTVTLHSDNGSPMKGATMLATLQKLGVMPSFSRPSVSNDNPYSESLFRTLKYRPEYPEKPFSDLIEARRWVSGFVDWYNNTHLHSGVKFVTPSERHAGLDTAILAKRKKVYSQARARHPERWSRNSRNWDPIRIVCLNNYLKTGGEIEKRLAA